MSENKSDAIDQLESLEAYIEALRGQPDVALRQLAGRNDPTSVRRRIAILIDSKKSKDVAEIIRPLEISELWIDLAAFALAGIGEYQEARKYLEWARTKNSPNLSHRTGVGFVDGLMQWIFREKPEGASILPGSISESEKNILYDISHDIGPICDQTLSRRTVETEVESQLLQRYFDVLYLLGEHVKASQLFDVLLTRNPIPIKLGQVMLQGFGKASKELATRLWEEHPNSFRARVLSCLVLARELGDLQAAREKAYALSEQAQSKEQREELCELIYELSSSDDADAFQKVAEVANRLLGANSYLFALIRADQLLQTGKHQESLDLLESVRNEDDSRWLRGFANAKLRTGKALEALGLFKRLVAIIPSPEVFRVIAKLSRELGLVDDERTALDQILALDPENASARWHLAMLFANCKEFSKAAKQFEILRNSLPDDEAVIANLAVSYCFAGDIDHALTILVPKPGQTLSLSLQRTRAQLLQASGHVIQAFDELAKTRTDHWEKPEYLVGYMELAYYAGKEKEAHDALTKLQELHQKGAVDAKLMHPASVDDMREWVEAAVKRNDEIRRYLLQGKMTWLTAAEMQREVPLWSWLLKTQSLNWVWDEPLNRATYAVYSTNSFRVLQKAESSQTLERILCPPRGTPIVVDLSALITLHELGLLHKTAEYFGMLNVPAVYLSKVLDDTLKLLPHQLSQKQAAQDIVSACKGRISVLTAGDSGGDLILVDEYADPDEGSRAVLRLRNLLDTMYKAGIINDDQMEQARLVAHKPLTLIELQQTFITGSQLVISGLTLVTLHGLGLLDVVSKVFEVHITKSDYDEVNGQVQAFEALEEARTKYIEFWESLRNDERVRFISAKARPELEGKVRGDGGLAFDAMLIAKERNLPLLADDRVCQALVLNEYKDDEKAAFGTDSVIIEMLEAEHIEAREAARLLSQLMKWRYRFILMPPEAMKALADQYRAHPPGDALRQVAKYIHDCMRDPGLFGGLEPTTPPISIAIRLYQSWSNNISELVMDVWKDADIPETYAEEFTEWAMTEMLPSPPKVLDEKTQAILVSLTALTVMTRALIRGSDNTQFERINHGLRAMANALGLDDTEYFEAVVKVTHAADD